MVMVKKKESLECGLGRKMVQTRIHKDTKIVTNVGSEKNDCEYHIYIEPQWMVITILSEVLESLVLCRW